MDKLKSKYIATIGLLISFLAVFITGLIKFPGLLHTFGIQLKSLPLREINIIHNYAGLAMGILVFVHLVQNWAWLVAMTKNYLGKK